MDFISTVLNRAIDESLQFFKSKNIKQNVFVILAISFPIYFIEYLVSETSGGHGLVLSAMAVLFNYFGFLITITVIVYIIKQDKILRNEPPSAAFNTEGLITYLKTNLLKVILETTKSALLMVAGFLLLILPGVYLTVKLCLVPYIAQDENKKMQSEAIGYSFHLTKKHFWSIFLLTALLLLTYMFGISFLGLTSAINFILYPLFNALLTLVTVLLVLSMYEVLKAEDEKE